MIGFSDVRQSISIAAATSQNHAPVMKSNVVNDSKFIIGNCLLESPEEIIGGSHQQGTVVNRVLFIPAKRWIRIFFGNAIESFDERLDWGGKVLVPPYSVGK